MWCWGSERRQTVWVMLEDHLLSVDQWQPWQVTRVVTWGGGVRQSTSRGLCGFWDRITLRHFFPLRCVSLPLSFSSGNIYRVCYAKTLMGKTIYWIEYWFRNERQVDFACFLTFKMLPPFTAWLLNQGGYKGWGHLLDLRGWGQNSFCHLCSFRKYCLNIVYTYCRKLVEVFE